MNSAEVLIKFKGDESEADKAIKDQEQKLDSLKKKGEVAFLGLTAAADAFTVSVLGGGIQYNAEIETYLTRLQTLTGSAEKANDILEQIKKDALATPFEVSSLTQAESLLLSTGITAEDARKDILALGNAISASGGGNAELSRMAVNLQQIKNVGKASALDIKQFAYAGIDIYGLLADSMGVTREEASKLDVSYEMLSTALQNASNEGGKYYGAMEKQSKTYNGAMSNLTESLQVLKGEFSKGLFKAIKKLIPQLTKMFDWLGKNYKIVVAIAAPLLTFLNVVTGFLIIKKVTAGFAAFNAVLAANPIMAVVAGITALVVGIVYLWNNCEAFRNFILGVIENIKMAINSVIQVVQIVVNTIITVVTGVVEVIAGIVTNVVTTIMNILNPIIDFVQNLILLIIAIIVAFIETIYNVLAPIVSFVWNNILSPVINLFSTAFNTIKNVVSTVFSTIRGVMSSIVGFVWNNILSPIITHFTNAFNQVFNIMKDVFTKMKKTAQTIINAVVNIIKMPINALIDGINAFIGALNKIKIPNWVPGVGGKGLNFKKIPKLATGTNYVPEDTLAMIHEGEAVVPKKFNPYANGLKPSTIGSMQTSNLKPIFNIYVESKTDPLGQTVANIKTFGNGAKNDYNYGVGV